MSDVLTVHDARTRRGATMRGHATNRIRGSRYAPNGKLACSTLTNAWTVVVSGRGRSGVRKIELLPIRREQRDFDAHLAPLSRCRSQIPTASRSQPC